ncbi:MAG: hypothetical protein NVS4B3_11740 [Gemmatimonadaceae bacterium]
MKAVVMLACAATSLSCTYFNAVYNARSAIRDGDRLAQAGRERESREAYALAAATAESLLARDGSGRWAEEAQFIAGRGEALAGDCARGGMRLHGLIDAGVGSLHQRSEASVALGACLARSGDYQRALTFLEPAVRSADRALARTAALWATRAASALGLTDKALQYAAVLPPADAEWERVFAAIRVGEYRKADEMLGARARAGDLREATSSAVDDLWVAGQRGEAVGVLDRYEAAAQRRALPPGAALGRLHLQLADRAARDGVDSIAAEQYRAITADSDSAVAAAAGVGGAVVGVRRARTLDAVAQALDRGATTPEGRQTLAPMRAARILVDAMVTRPDPTGASLFLAAEVARDSLHAPVLAALLFARVATDYPGSLLAAKGLLAAAAIEPDSAAVFAQRVRDRYTDSPEARFLAGGAPLPEAITALQGSLLRAAWGAAVAVHDTVPTNGVVPRRPSDRRGEQGQQGSATASLPPPPGR